MTPEPTRPPTEAVDPDSGFDIRSGDMLALDLAMARTCDEVSQVVAHHLRRAFGVSAAVVWWLDDRGHTSPAVVDGCDSAGIPRPDLAAYARSWEDGLGGTRTWLSSDLTATLRTSPDVRIRTATLFAGAVVVGAVALALDADAPPAETAELATVLRSAGEALGRARNVGAASELVALAATSDDALATITPEGVVLAWNPAAERITGYPADEVVGRSLAMFSTPGRAPRACARRWPGCGPAAGRNGSCCTAAAGTGRRSCWRCGSPRSARATAR